METLNTSGKGGKHPMADGGMSHSGSQEGPSVTWLHDQEFRKAVLEGADSEHLDPPTPTQKPRPISSRFSPSSSSTSVVTSRPPRKRLCRNHRSLPPSYRGSSSASLAYPSGSSSLPQVGPSTLGSEEESKTRLDLLLDQFLLQSSPLPKRTVETRSKEKERALEKDKGRRRSGKENEGVDRQEGRGRGKEKAIGAGGSHERLKEKIEQDNSGLSAASGSRPPSNIIPLPPPFSAASTSAKLRSTASNPLPSSRSPLSPIKPDILPRIGLGTKPARTFASSSGRKAFKTPFLEPKQAVRSSPRRAGGTNPTSSRSSFACPQPHPPRPHSREAHTSPPRATFIPAPQPSPSRTHTPSRPESEPRTVELAASNASGFINFDVGEDEPEGDTSFDSLDGFFNEGGPEVERLLRQVDGKP